LIVVIAGVYYLKSKFSINDQKIATVIPQSMNQENQSQKKFRQHFSKNLRQKPEQVNFLIYSAKHICKKLCGGAKI